MADPTLAQFRDRTLLPRADVDAMEVAEPGWLLRRVVLAYSKICARLKKRYAVPFGTPIPEIVLGWVVDVVTHEAYEKRGYNPTSQQDAEIAKRAETAWAEVKEAADCETGLFDLPLLQDAPGASGVTQGGPFGYSEASPYAWTDVQREALRGGR